jgi:3-oxoacyl-[acyl-carrier protein] reductase
MAPLPFAGKHCAIIGATGIIGSAVAQAFARQGAVLSLLGRSAVESRARLEQGLPAYSSPPSPPSHLPSGHQFIRLDVAQRDSIKGVFGSRASPEVKTHLRSALVRTLIG